MGEGRPWLLVAGSLSAAASVLHLVCIVGGPDWYRFFGAGESIARAAERGSSVPALLTLAIAAVLAVWAAFAFSGAGLTRPWPLLRTALVAITAIYLVRGLALFFPSAMSRPDLSPAFLFWSSLVVLAIGVVHLIGLWRTWPHLKGMH
ncbi:MAG: putative rane protein [Sphingomonas bacterium]|uniref:hypothetical protein n=1 Tax=Sphingomonas bacterium TaxID=1895847 RepID=UPI0026186EA3|nr:hypothetical protein [Sphingomonas bacterium]MDB5696132.1 putative rane protein [Sphingomonas bacterium]